MCLMKKWPALQPCNNKVQEASSTELSDRLCGLPHDVLLLIMSSFTAKEVARTRLVSKRLKMWLLRYFPKLNFENPMAMKKFWEMVTDDVEFVSQERCKFVRCVDEALKEYLDTSIDEFRVKFDLDSSCQSDIDKWMTFAFSKRVKRLELDFELGSRFYRVDSELPRYSLKLDCYKPLGVTVNHSLASVCLKDVNITSEVVESLLHWCPFLENLCIVKSENLTYIRSSSLQLKHLDVSRCPSLVRIDISAPKLLFFRYYGEDIELKVRHASSLSVITYGGGPGVEILYGFETLLGYFPQLHRLSLNIPLNISHREDNRSVEHLHFQPFAKLKVLELCVYGSYQLSIIGWIPLIEACVVLEKLTLKFDCFNEADEINSRAERNGNPLKSLKTLEIFGYRGQCVDFELANYVVKNAIELQEVIVDVGIPSYYKDDIDPHVCVMELREKIPHDVKFVLINSDA